MKHFSHMRISIFILLLFISGILLCKGEVSSSEAKKMQVGNENISVADERTITVYYFHTNYRCYSCTKIEKLTGQALKKNFSKILKSGRMKYKTVNIEEDQNKHFVKDYQLFTKTVVLSDHVRGEQKKWKRLDKTWSYLNNADAFDKYIKDEVIAFIK